MGDARFEDADDAPLRLIAQEAGDLQVLAALVQDAVFPITEMTWSRRQRRFALLLNRFRWEDRAAAEREGRPFERVRSLLVFETVLGVRTQGIDRADKDVVLSLLSVSFAPGDEGAGVIDLILAGDGAVALQVEALEVTTHNGQLPSPP
ncbi:MAG: hypothetical protein B7Y02_17820 [Rhodobacterales bacterium 17-64-5]|nr:MAG: hypothetical protein B7Y02_17820 [Rhodobacterales bacterium 17-64-5]